MCFSFLSVYCLSMYVCMYLFIYLSIYLSICLSIYFICLLLIPAPWHVLQKGWKETNCVTFSPDGSQIATGNDFCELHLWNMTDIKVSSQLTPSVQPRSCKLHTTNAYSGCTLSFPVTELRYKL